MRSSLNLILAGAACCAGALLVACGGSGSQTVPVTTVNRGIASPGPLPSQPGTTVTPVAPSSPVSVPTPTVSSSPITGLPSPGPS